MLKEAVGAAVIVGTLFGSVGVVDARGADVPPPPRTQWMKTPCGQEDSLNCFWNAQVQGNGEGHSFYAKRVKVVNTDGETLYKVDCHFFVSRKMQYVTECQRVR